MNVYLTARLIRKHSSTADNTEAKQSDSNQLCGTRFPRTKIWYSACPRLSHLSPFMVLISMVGSVGPRDLQRRLYSSLLISYQVSNFCTPVYYSLYDRSQIFLSDGRGL